MVSILTSSILFRGIAASTFNQCQETSRSKVRASISRSRARRSRSRIWLQIINSTMGIPANSRLNADRSLTFIQHLHKLTTESLIEYNPIRLIRVNTWWTYRQMTFTKAITSLKGRMKEELRCLQSSQRPSRWWHKHMMMDCTTSFVRRSRTQSTAERLIMTKVLTMMWLKIWQEMITSTRFNTSNCFQTTNSSMANSLTTWSVTTESTCKRRTSQLMILPRVPSELHRQATTCHLRGEQVLPSQINQRRMKVRETSTIKV